jgi:hypothetical protein
VLSLGIAIAGATTTGTGCCFLGLPTGPVSAPAPTPATTTPTTPTTPTVSRTAPLPPPLAEGLRVPVLGRELTLILPSTAAARHPVDDHRGIDGLLGWDDVQLDGHLILELRDLPCTATPDLMAGALAEIERRQPSATPIEARAVAVADPTIRVVELIPGLETRHGNSFVFAWFVIDLDGHVILATLHRWCLADGLETPSRDDARRALGESVIQSIAHGDWRFVTRIGDRGTYGDLFDEIDAPPEGWVGRGGSCCNEEPPYTTLFDEVLLPIRVLGSPARARVSARSFGHCASGPPGPSGTMFGRPMQWTRDGARLCWVERPTTDDDRGITWHVRGATDADLAEALTVAATLGR